MTYKTRLRSYLKLVEVDPEKEYDFFKDTDEIFMGTNDHWDNLDEPFEPDNWVGFDFPEEFNMLVYSQAGYRKSTGIIQNLIPYFYGKGYKVCVFEAKNSDYSFNLRKNKSYPRIYPGAYNKKIDTYSCLPSYLDTPQMVKAGAIPEGESKRFDRKITIFASSLDEQRDWETLIGSEGAGAEHLHNLNIIHEGDMNKMRRDIMKGRYLNSRGETIVIHSQSRPTLLRNITLFVDGDKFLNSPKCSEIDFDESWGQGKLVTIPFYSMHPHYMSLYAKMIIDKQVSWLKRNPGMKVLNIWEDCQLFLDKKSDRNNPGKERIKIAMRLDRKQGINNVFAIQDAWDFTTEIMNSCNHFMLGFIYETNTFHFPDFVKAEIHEMQQRIKEYKEGGIIKRSVPYMYIPSNYMKRFVFYPQDPLCGTY